ncbi:MAG: hypothetical protein ABFD85_09675 [Phycisphaerae bacterium]
MPAWYEASEDFPTGNLSAAEENTNGTNKGVVYEHVAFFNFQDKIENMDLDLEVISARDDLQVLAIRYCCDEMRIVLAEAGNTEQYQYAIVLNGIHAYFDHGVIGFGSIVIKCGAVGSFGWKMKSEERPQHYELQLVDKASMGNPFRVIADSIEYRIATEDDRNWPG